MELDWKISNEVRRAIWDGLRAGRNYRHGVSGDCPTRFERAESMLTRGLAGRCAGCLDLYVDALSKLSEPKVLAALAAAGSPTGYARTAARRLCINETRHDASVRGGLSKPRQLRGQRLVISKALNDRWLDELASRLLELSSSSRNPAQAWPFDRLAAEKAMYFEQTELAKDLDGIRADIECVERVIRSVGADWHWRVMRGPGFAWQVENPLSLDVAGRTNEVMAPIQDVQMQALRLSFAHYLVDPRITGFTAAMEAACAELSGQVPADKALLDETGAHLLADLLADRDLSARPDDELLEIVTRSLGALAAAKVTRRVLVLLRRATRAK